MAICREHFLLIGQQNLTASSLSVEETYAAGEERLEASELKMLPEIVQNLFRFDVCLSGI